MKENYGIRGRIQGPEWRASRLLTPERDWSTIQDFISNLLSNGSSLNGNESWMCLNVQPPTFSSNRQAQDGNDFLSVTSLVSQKLSHPWLRGTQRPDGKTLSTFPSLFLTVLCLLFLFRFWDYQFHKDNNRHLSLDSQISLLPLGFSPAIIISFMIGLVFSSFNP